MQSHPGQCVSQTQINKYTLGGRTQLAEWRATGRPARALGAPPRELDSREEPFDSPAANHFTRHGKVFTFTAAMLSIGSRLECGSSAFQPPRTGLQRGAEAPVGRSKSSTGPAWAPDGPGRGRRGCVRTSRFPFPRPTLRCLGAQLTTSPLCADV